MNIIAYTIVFRPLYTNQQLYYVDHILDKYFFCLYFVHRPIVTVAVCEDTFEMKYYVTFVNSMYGTTCDYNIVEVCESQHAHLMIAMCSAEENGEAGYYG